MLGARLDRLRRITRVTPRCHRLSVRTLGGGATGSLRLVRRVLVAFRRRARGSLPTTFRTLRTNSGEAFRRYVRHVRNTTGVLGLRGLVGVDRRLRVAPISSSDGPRVLRLLGSMGRRVTRLSRRVTIFYRGGSWVTTPAVFGYKDCLPTRLAFVVEAPNRFIPRTNQTLPLPTWRTNPHDH